MNTVTDNNLKELRDLINSKFDKVFEEFTAIKVEIATLKEGQNGLSKRLDNLEFIARSVIYGSILVALLLGLAKILYPNLLT